jgi:hypothetical protein
MLSSRFVRHPRGDASDRSVGLRNDNQIGATVGVLPDNEHRLAAPRMERIVDPPLDWVLAGSSICFEQRLDDADVGAVLQQVRGEAMAQRMGRHPFPNPRRFGRLMDGAVDLPG